jgi:hypothetical protein
MIKLFFQNTTKYKSQEVSGIGEEYIPSQKLLKLLSKYQRLITLQIECGKPVSPDLLVDLRLENYIEALPKYRNGGSMKKLIDSLVQSMHQILRFKELKVRGDISRLLSLHPELKQQYASTLIEMSLADALKAPEIEKPLLKALNHNRILLLINYFLDMIKNGSINSK